MRRRSTPCRDLRRLLWLSLALIVLGAPHSARAQDDQLTYAQAGAYAVGVATLRIERDPSRPLTGFIWYPAQADSTLEYADYGYGKRSARARLGAQPERVGAPYPLIIFSHGYGGYAGQSTFLTEHLASHGFAVIAVNHSGSARGDTDPQTGLTLGWYLRPRDVLSQIAWAEAANADPQSPFYGLLDLARIGVSGHSYGGYTALAAAGAQLDFRALEAYCAQTARFDFACLARDAEPILAPILPQDPESETLRLPSDPRIAAVLALAPFNAPLMGARGLAHVTAPTLVMVGTADAVTPLERDAEPIYELIGAADKALVSFEGGDHLLFADCPPLLASLPRCNDSVWEAARAHALTRHFATAFFAAALRGDGIARSALVAPPKLPSVRYRGTFD
ncbi:MAG: alpha/beta hydrolase family protein [Aggregatilineales bacterium]